MTLLHFLTNITEKTLPDLMSYQQELSPCGAACRVSLPEVQSDFNHLKVKITDMKNELQSHYANGYKAGPDDRFFEVMQPFIEKAEHAFKKTEAGMLEMETAFKDCVKFYGEDAAVMKADEFFGIFKTFSASFEKARGDNQKQEEKEAQKEKARTAAKARQEQMVAKKNRIRVQGEGKSLFFLCNSSMWFV
ncbi:hypothetical protein B0O80DRAFT_466131 [Mortierella sp. GBAus27b]|nr:hypothetical protein B0O80DRAFT_466131 [Mortierella sp. GBAus27b]